MIENANNIGALAKRLAAAALEIQPVGKRGRNEFHKYNYATAEDVKSAARLALANNGIVIIPVMSDIEQQITPQQGKADKVLTRVTFDYVLSCEEASMTVRWVAEAQDTGDKGINKCATTGLKYFLINLLQIPIGDDPDADADKAAQMRQRAKSPAKKQAPAKKKAPAKVNGRRPLEPYALKIFMAKKTEGDNGSPATEKQIPFVARKLQEVWAGDDGAEQNYRSVLRWLWDVDSAKDLTFARAQATLDWLLVDSGPDDSGDIPLHKDAIEEAKRVLRQALVDAGQTELL